MIKAFVRLNRHICAGLSNKFPKTFQGPSYVTEFLGVLDGALVSNPTETILEVGGADRPIILGAHKKK